MADWITEAEALHRDCADGGCVVSRLIRELQQQRHRTAEFQTIAAGFANRAVAAESRLAAVEALADAWEADEGPTPRAYAGWLRAALAGEADR